MTSRFTSITIPDLNARVSTGAGDRSHALGYAAGYAEGIRQAETELGARRAELEAQFSASIAHADARAARSAAAVDTAVAAMAARTTPLIEEVQDTLAAAALDLAEAILGVELSAGTNGARAAVTRVLSSVERAVITTIRMNPDDLSVISDVIAGNPDLTFTADPELRRGDAIAVLPYGWLDARITTASSHARAELLNIIEAPAAVNTSA